MQFIKYTLQKTAEQNDYSDWIDYSLTEPLAWTKYLPDPFSLLDMASICQRLKAVLASDKRILIYGDYDLDGMSAAASLYLTLAKLRSNLWQIARSKGIFKGTVLANDLLKLSVYIPDRLQEGYSLSKQAVDYIVEQNYDLVITVDCGVKSYEEVKQLVAANVEVIITDHHECGTTLPEADFVLNPKRLDEKYINRSLSGSAVVFKLAQALELTMQLELGSLTEPIVEIAALGIISDVMDLSFENWQIIRAAFNKLQSRTCQIGLVTLLAKLDIKPALLTYSDIAFYICPKFNACGRINNAYLGLLCLITDDRKEAVYYASELIKINAKRQAMTEEAWQASQRILYAEPELLQKAILCVPLEKAHSGIVGLVAARLQAKYLKPSICFTSIKDEAGNELLKGSGRSFANFNLYLALSNLQSKHKELFVAFGGHKEAIGLTIYKAKFKEFNQLLHAEVNDKLKVVPSIVKVSYDKDVQLNENKSNLPTLSKLQAELLKEPYGPKRNLPIYLFAGEIKSSSFLGQEQKHVKFNLASGENLLAFNKAKFASLANLANDKLKLLITANLHEFRNLLQPQYVVKDAYLSWSDEELLALEKSDNLITDLSQLTAKQIYMLLANLYKVLKIYSDGQLFYLDASCFGTSYFPLLAQSISKQADFKQAPGRSGQATLSLLAKSALRQCLQILQELNIIKYYQLTDEILLLKLLNVDGQKLSLQSAPTFSKLVADDKKQEDA